MSRWTGFFTKRAGIGFLCLLLLFVVFSGGTGEARGRRVLALMSYDAAWPTARPFIEEMRKSLPFGMEIRYVFMDTKNTPIDVAQENALREIARRVDGRADYSAVYVCDDDAFNFMCKHRQTLFAGLPVVFNGVNDIEAANRAAAHDPLMTGVIEAYPIEATLRIARSIQPEAKQAVAFVDGSATGTAAARQFMECQKRFPELRFSLIDGSKLTQKEIARKCRARNKDTIPLFLVLGFDKDGNTFNLTQAVHLVSDNTSVAVYRADENGIGDGLVGGAAIEYGETGRVAGLLMKQFLDGGNFADQPPEWAPFVPIFDEQRMEHFGITRAMLPANTKYINAIPGFWDRYKEAALPMGLLTAILLALLVAIGFDSRKSRRLLQETQENENRLQTLMDMIPAGIGLFEMDKDGKLVKHYLSQGYFDMLGTKREARPQGDSPETFPYIHPDDRPVVMREIAECIREKREFDKLFRMQDGAGRYRWLNLRARFIPAEDGRVLAYGCYYDNDAIVEAHRALHAEQAAMLAALAHSGLQAWEYYPERKAARRLIITSPYHFSGGSELIENFPETLVDNNIIYAQDMARFDAMHRQLLAGADEVEAVLRIRTENGTYSWEDVRYTSLRDADGNRIKILGTAANLDTYKQLEERFLATLRQTGIIVGMYDIPNHHFELTFRDRRHIYTAAPDDMIAEGIIHAEDADTFREMFRHIQSGKPSIEKALRCNPDGTGWRWFRFTFTLVPDREGRPLHVMATALDITEQMAREQHYLEELLRRRSLEQDIVSSLTFNLTQNVVQECTIDRRPQENLTEAHLDELVRREAAFIPNAEDRATFLTMLSAEHIRLAKRTGNRQSSFEYQRRFPDGRLRWVECRMDVMENPQTGDTMFFAYLQNIHAKKIAEIAHANAAEGLMDYILCVNPETGEARFIRPPRDIANPEQLMVGFDYDTSIPRVASQLPDPDEREEFLRRAKAETIVKDLETQSNIFFSFWQDSPEGRRRKETRVAYLDASKTIVIILQRDITELYRAEEKQREALRKALLDAEEASRAKSDFLSRMSHEIRTPMNAIIGLTALASQHITDTDYIADSLSKVDSAAHFLLGLINDILDISRIERGKMQLDNTPHHMETFLDGIDVIIRSRAHDSGVRYERKMVGALPAACVFDELKLKQVLVNILSNAVKFTPKDGEVTFVVEETGRTDGRSSLLFTVIDTGIGIDKNFLPRLFNPFEQESAGSTTRYGGTGLGLAISKNIVDLMGGAIEVDSEKGKGTTFRVRVTFAVAADEAGPGATPVGRAEDIAFDGKRALLAEDNAINLEIATAILEAKGFTVEPACDGKEAVEKFAASDENTYDIILMDIRMPFLDGFGATEEIRAMKRPDARTVPIVAMTANAFEEDIKHARDVGMDDYLTKPVEPSKIYQTLWKILRNR
ncbi:MAG: PAS domain-containing protein [Schwartzia sp.]|nr:PAS domain-containing protein [Schwartzia sp. (in: firmicutes)]